MINATPPENPAKDAGASGDELTRYRLLVQGLDSIELPMHLVDTEYTILYINKAAANLLGMRPEDAVGKRCYDLYRTGNCKTAQCPCRVAMEQRVIYRCDNTCGDVIIDCTGPR
jgi:methyl-accepting chemotaxis protein